MISRQRLTSIGRVVLRAGALALVAFALVSVVWAGSKPSYVPNEYLISVRAGSSMSQVKAVAARIGATVLGSLPMPDSYVIKMTGSPARARAGGAGSSFKALGTSWIIQSIQPNFLYYATAEPNDEFFSKQWGMQTMGMPAVWDTVRGADTVTVAVLDTGVADDHPDLQDQFGNPRCLPGYDFVDEDNNPYDDAPLLQPEILGAGHGTHVAGIIAAQGDNGIGVTGVCWDGVKILPVRVLDSSGAGSTVGIIRGLEFAQEQGANVVNMSLGGGGPDSLLQMTIKKLVNGTPMIIVVAAAGNDGDTPLPDVGYPAAFTECIAVGATGPTDNTAFYSSYGPGNEVDIAAPGGDSDYGDDGLIFSTVVNYTYDDKGKLTGKELTYKGEQGTSMACPHVAGAVAILLSAGVPPSMVRKQLEETATRPAGYDPMKMGAGIVDVNTALELASVKIISPANGKPTSSTPDVQVSLRGVILESVQIFLDYADDNDDGVPNIGEVPMIAGMDVESLFNPRNGSVEFSIPRPGGVALKPGSHKLYAQADKRADFSTISDQSTFSVKAEVVTSGMYLFAFPHLVSSATDGPSTMLDGADFSGSAEKRSKLIRWIAAPRSITDSTQYGYETFDPLNSADYTWRSNTLPGTSAVVNGGIYRTLGGSETNNVIGSGYWLVLGSNASLVRSLPSLDGSTEFDASKGYTIRLYNGWNMIGNPYPHGVPWQTSMFKYRGQIRTLASAVAAGWMSPTAFGYDSTQGRNYQRVTERDSLEAYRGYWVKSLVGTTDSPMEMVILP